ncbi:MAG: hypothetical protein KIG14_00405, partial [Candidatus Sacchiramonaceae bacterium]|nr:hypothetical protein [Candidatus Saccharimonadaceae bacterium]
LQEATILVDGQQAGSGSAASGKLSIDFTFTKPKQKITVRVRDSGGYISEKTYPGPSNISSGGSDGDDD